MNERLTGYTLWNLLNKLREPPDEETLEIKNKLLAIMPYGMRLKIAEILAAGLKKFDENYVDGQEAGDLPEEEG